MNVKQPSELTDQELLNEVDSIKSSGKTHALFIGVMFGIIIFSIWKNTIGLFTLIPLFLIYKLLDKSKRKRALELELKARNLS